MKLPTFARLAWVLSMLSLPGALLVPAQLHASACIDRFRPAFERQDIAALTHAFKNADTRQVCSEDQIENIRYQATGLLAAKAGSVLRDGDAAHARELLIDAKGAHFRLASHWAVNAVLGDIDMGEESWAPAAQQYQEAYRLLVESGEREQRELTAEETQQALALYQLANEALVLAGDLRLAISRSGDSPMLLGGRGPVPQTTQLPVQFEFDSDALSSDGLQAASSLAKLLVSRKVRRVELVGHTDWVGSPDYNLDLSLRRARSLRAALLAELSRDGTPAPDIVVKGEGEGCPAQLSDPGRYTRDQLSALFRRVEIALDSSSASSRRCGPRVDG